MSSTSSNAAAATAIGDGAGEKNPSSTIDPTESSIDSSSPLVEIDNGQQQVVLSDGAEQRQREEEEVVVFHRDDDDGGDLDPYGNKAETAPPKSVNRTNPSEGQEEEDAMSNNNDEEEIGKTQQNSREEPFSFSVGMSSPSDTTNGNNQSNNHRASMNSLTLSQLEDRRRNSQLMANTAALSSEDEKQRSSLELRRMPVNVLLRQSLPEETTSDVSEGLEIDESDGIEDDFSDGTAKAGKKRRRRRRLLMMRRRTGKDEKPLGQAYDCLGKSCLRPGFTLRTQMMLSFGSICIITITVVVAICIALTIFAGDNVRDTAASTVGQISYRYRSTRARYVAEALNQRILLFDIVKLIAEATKDRFDGHPDPTDNGVPFKDIITETNVYPIIGDAMPLEWNVTPNVNEENYQEFLQSRWQFYSSRPVDTTNAAFSIQGLCDPDESDPDGDLYLPNCTEANNDLLTGGVYAPSTMTESLHRKGSDLVPFFRTLFESREEIRDLGLAFMNNGAGAFVNYPQYAASSKNSYVSVGCDWLLSPNPYDPSRTIGSADMIQHCHAAGETVSSRLYNPMERAWCRDMALNPDTIQANAWEDAWAPGFWMLITGKAVYDRRTNEFVACIYMGISLALVDEILSDSKAIEGSESSVIKFDEAGNVVSSSKSITRTNGDGSMPIHDLGLGLTEESYSELYNLIDYENKWDPEAVRQAYYDFASNDDEYFVAAYPIPPIPDRYDPSYRPIFLVIASSLIEAQDAIIAGVNENVDYRVRKINRFAVITWAVGIVVATLIISAMAHMLTSPLTHMNKVANEIVSNFGDTTKEDEIQQSDDTVLSEAKCTPKTELSEVVSEFNVMVASFSGASQARSQKFKDDEVENRFPDRKLFMRLYSQRSDASFKYNPTGLSVMDDPQYATEDGSVSVAYMNFGSNVAANLSTDIDTSSPGAATVAAKKRNSTEPQKSCSPLFWWIVVLIVLPLFFITILVAAGVITTINSEFDQSTIDTESELIDLHNDALAVYAKLRSDLVAAITEKSIIDLYVLHRFASWLIFGGLKRSDSFTEVTTGIEECKTFSSNFSQCDYYEKEFVCDCASKQQGYEQACTSYKEPMRHREVNYWTAESSTSVNGDRFSTNYPVRSFSAQTTDWWPNATTVPGFESGISDGYESTYDRLRVVSAIPVFHPLQNYGYGQGNEINIGTNVAFEADGLFFGNGGCFTTHHVELVQWKSTEDNNAANLRPELCPLGKHGYDPRCRGWYDEGRNISITKGTILHVTAPYLFAGAANVNYAQSATMAIVDPTTGQHVGQTLLDFLATPVYRSLENETFLYQRGFPVLIAVEGNSVNTVIGPGVSTNKASVPIAQSVLPYDAQCKDSNVDCMHRFEVFESIASDMRSGNFGSKSFERLTQDGDVETMHMAYAPVNVTTLTPTDSSDYSRGIDRAEQLIYSLALVESEEGLLLPFSEIEQTIRRQSNVVIVVLSIVIFLAICIIVYISHILASSFTEPMLYLLGLIKYINKHGVDQDPPPVRQVHASYEIVAFSKTLEALYRIVRSANIAFFAGELEVAYRVLIDALRLFRRLDNKKAIGIACNNIGNTLLAIYREMQASHEKELYGLTKTETIQQGIAHYHTAIQLGEKAYDEFYDLQGWSPQCLDFMQHLSNRYFNRGLFLLIIKDDHEKPDEIEQLGMRDLQIAGDMDQEVVSYSDDIGWGSADRVEKRFNINLIRIRGYNILRSIGYMNDWGVEDLIEDTMSILQEESKNDESLLFASVGLAGRLQEIEVHLMRRKMLEGDLETAAKIAVRMLIEDERVFGEAILLALEVLSYYVSSKFVDDEFRDVALPALNAYHQIIKDVIQEKRQNARDELESTFSGSLSRSLTQSGSLVRYSHTTTKTGFTSARHEESSRFVTMEDF